MLRDYAGAAKRTALASGINATDMTISLADATGYPTGAAGPFAIALDLGVAAEEKVLIASRSGNTLTVETGGRGYDGTTAAAHGSGASADHVLTATDIREANAFINSGGTLTAATPSSVVLVVKGAVGQTANLAEIKNNAGTILSSVSANGAALFSVDVDTKPLRARGAAGQTNNLFEAQNSSGTPLAYIESAGYFNCELIAAGGVTFGRRRLEVGAADSGGTGFRVVRVTN